MKFKIGITGKGEVPSEFYSQEGQELILKLCYGSVPTQEIPSKLLEIFKSVAALREDKNECYLNFTCFLQKDIDYLNLKCDELSKSLAGRIQKEASDQIPLNVKFDEVSYKKYLYFIVGCVGLDWHGLKILEDLNLIVSYKNLIKNKYGNYSLFGNENKEKNIKELYWGSHNYKFGDFCFTTFGDHTSRRLGFPDLLNINHNDDLSKTIYLNMTQYYMTNVGRALTKKSKPDKLMEHILEELKYLKNEKLNIPVIIDEDMNHIRQFINNIDNIVKGWLIDNSDDFDVLFKNLTPVNFGVDFKEVLIQIWHYIFGHTNKHLSRNGYFFNPYSTDSDFDGYLPVVHESSCSLSNNDFI